jgi:hypothetical protein
MAKLTLLIILSTIIFSSCSKKETYKTYSECILKNMKGVQSDVAAREIRRACRERGG